MVVFPVMVKGQREAAKLNNVLPEMTKLTNRMSEAKQSGNKFECKFSFLSPSIKQYNNSEVSVLCVCVKSDKLVMAVLCCSCQSLH